MKTLFWCLITMQPIFVPAPVHLLITAPAGAGKSTALAITNAIHWPKALVTLDIKGEIFCAASRWRAQVLGRRQVRLDPLQVLGPGGDTLNVLVHMNQASPHFLADIRALAEAMVIKDINEREPHWSQSSEIWLAALLADNVRHFRHADRNLQTLRTVMTDGKLLADAVARLVQSDDEFLRRDGGKVLNYAGKELFSTMTSLNRHVSFLDDPLIAQFTRKSSFDPRSLLDGNTDIYFILPPQYLRSQGRLARLVLTSLFKKIVAAGIDRHREILFLLDEFPSLGRMEIVLDAITQYRGFGVKLCMIVQSLAQLQQMFPEGQHEVVLANTDQVYLGIRDYTTAEMVSKKLGDATVHTNNGQTSEGRTWSRGQSESTGGNSNWSRGVGEVGKPLLRPEEVLKLGNQHAVVFVQNQPPLLVQMCPYYADRAFLEGTADLGRRELTSCLIWLALAAMLAVLVTFWQHNAQSPLSRNRQPDAPLPIVLPMPVGL